MSGQRWKMERDTLSDLAKKTSGNTQNLGGLVKQLVQAATPLEGKMAGAGKQMFDSFKSQVDGIANDLNAGLASINSAQSGMDTAYRQGEQDMAQNAKKAQGAADFNAAKFGKH
ncbi:hypothetical protein AB0E69_06410 [Kribbella sp. NPDC026611]|uniref:hypothetical protein n=1 Tax=Kribbella sp. NPDC026611 TaxID=3154911 RepID=UPI0033E1BD1E